MKCTQQRTLGFETTLWSASFNNIWNDFSYPEITVDINTIRSIDDLQMLEILDVEVVTSNFAGARRKI